MNDFWTIVFGIGMFVGGYIFCALKIKHRQRQRLGLVRRKVRRAI